MPNSAVVIPDGALDFSLGVDSIKTTTVASQNNPNGLPRNALAWLVNGTVRDGGISPRWAWLIKAIVHDGTGIFQGAYLYEPADAFPYFIASIGGRIYQVFADGPAVVDLSAASGLTNPANVDYAYFCQAEEFLIIQAGDGATLPLFWDGTTLRRSLGLTPPVIDNGNVTIKNVNDAANVGQVVNAPVLLAINSQFIRVQSFVVPAVGATVVVNAVAPIPSGWFTPPSGNFFLNSSGNGFYTGASPPAGYFGAFQVTAFTSSFVVSASTVELPAAFAMDYFMGRVWYSFGRAVAAGDIVGGPSGTAAYGYRDSVLKVTENPVAIGGDGFLVPAQAGNIRALKHSANLDSAFGQGRLFIFTLKEVYALNVPVTRNDWIAATTNNQPLMTVVQQVNGSVNDRSVASTNGDLFYQSIEPGIRSLMQSIRYFGQWGNIVLSSNEQRALQFNDRSLMRFASGIEFDNRMFQAILPRQLPQGVVHDGIVPLDFMPISSFKQGASPNWEGIYDGLSVLQLHNGRFGGRERGFSFTVNRTTGAIELWEMVVGARFEKDDQRIQMQIEFPAFTLNSEFDLKRLVGGEIWVDRLFGTVEFTIEYRVDGETCWRKWHQWPECSARNSAEDCANPIAYPLTEFGPCYKQTMVLPKPPFDCSPCTGRPSNLGYQFQPRLTIKGYCRVRGILLYLEKVERELYRGIVC